MSSLAKEVDITLKNIGLDVLTQPVFQDKLIGLRMEIGNPEQEIDDQYFHDAFERAYTIYKAFGDNFTVLRINLFFDMADSQDIREEDKKFDLGVICSATGLPLPMEERESTVEMAGIDDELTTLYQVECYWDLDKISFDTQALLMHIITTDFPDKHNFKQYQFEGSVHFVDTIDHVIIHLYDDRGMDIISASEEHIYNIYKDYNYWVLESERANIKRIFASYSERIRMAIELGGIELNLEDLGYVSD